MKLLLACLAAILLVAVLVGVARPTHVADVPARITGSARIVDGDTLWVGDFKIRLWGIDAPEMEKGGWPSKAALERLTHGRTVSCTDMGERSHNRIVALCCAGGRDIGRRLVASGLATRATDRADGIDARYAAGQACGNPESK